MKVCICYPPVSDEYDKIRDAGLAPHLSLLCLGTHIKNAVEDAEILLYDGHHDSYDTICNKLRKDMPDIIGFSVDFTNYNSSVALANYAKKLNPGVKIGCGSNHASNLYKQILNNQPSYDFVCINDGEELMAAYIRYLKGQLKVGDVPNLAYRDKGEIICNPIKVFDLKKMYPVQYELTDLNQYFKTQKEVFGEGFRMLQFTSQRGCANRPLCVFCGRYDDGMRFRNPKVYAREVAYYTEKYELTEVWDRSDSFVQNVVWLKEFAEEVNKLTDRFKEQKTTFKTYSRADQLLNIEVIAILKSLNFRMVFIGYEAGDNRILKNIGKNANTDIYMTATRNVLEAGISVDASFIVGLPGENKTSMKNHVNFVKRLSEMGLDKIRVNRILVLPGTPLYKKAAAVSAGIKDKDIVPMKDMQRLLFKTDYYDLDQFDNDADMFMEALNSTAHQMTDTIINKGGAVEGYGHGKGTNILCGDELQS